MDWTSSAEIYGHTTPLWWLSTVGLEPAEIPCPGYGAGTGSQHVSATVQLCQLRRHPRARRTHAADSPIRSIIIPEIHQGVRNYTRVYCGYMSLNVKNPETVRLVATLAKRLHVTQVQAINEAVSAKLEALDKTASPDVDSVLADIWNALTPDEIQAVQDRQAALYNEAGLPV